MAHSRKSFTTTVLSNINKFGQTNGQVKLPSSEILISAQQKFRFYLFIDDLPAAYITQIDRPSYEIQTQEHIILDHVVRYPIRVKWQPINFTIREIFSSQISSVGGTLLSKLLAQSYYYPDDINSSNGVQAVAAVADPALIVNDSIYGTKNLSKENLNRALGNIKIVSLDPDGNPHETWEIFNGMITSLKFSNLAYSEDGLTDIQVSVQYDWAKLTLR